MHIQQTANETKVLATIGFSKLIISCIIGVEEHERVQSQNVIVDLQVQYDVSSCVENDDFQKAIDYVQLSQHCIRLAQEGKYKLIETYAHDLLHRLHEIYPIHRSKVRVEKPSAIPGAACSFVELEKLT